MPFRSGSPGKEIITYPTGKGFTSYNTKTGKYSGRGTKPKGAETYTPTAKPKVKVRKGGRAVVKREQAAARKIIRQAAVPDVALLEAKHGARPPQRLAKTAPKTYKKAFDTYILQQAKKEGLKEDPLAELVISTAATAGVGGVASLAGKALGRAGKTAVGAKTASSSKTLLKKSARGVKKKAVTKAKRVKSTPRTAARKVKETPAKVKAAPRKAKRAATTSEGRKAAARSAARSAYAHPVGSAAGLSYAAQKTGVDVPGVKQASAFVEGHLEALKDNPIGTLETTGRAIPGIVTGPAALLGAAGSSVAHGTTKPLEKEASKQFEGLKEVGGKLLSGNPKTVQKAVEDEVGLSFVAPAPALSRVRHTKLYRDKRGNLRAKVATKRERTRENRRQELRDFKAGKGKKPRKIRHPVRDTHTGEERILRRTGKVLEGLRQSVEVSRATARAKAQGEREALLAQKDVVKHIRRSPLRKGKGHNVGDVLATVAVYGLSRDRDKALTQLDDIEASIGKHHPDEIPAETITDLQNIAWIREHPEVFSDKHFWRAVDAYKKQAREIEHSGRKKVLAIADVYGLKRPEERLEEGVQVGGKTVKTHFYKDLSTLERKQAELADLRADAKRNLRAAERAPEAEKARHAAVGTKIAARAKLLERELKDYRKGFKQARRDYAREVQATIRLKGHEQPAYVKDVKPRQGLVAEPGFPGGRSARKQHMATGSARQRGVVARDFETLVNQSIAEPRMRRWMHHATTNFVERWATPVNGRRYLTSEEINRAINRGELDESQYAVLHSQFFKQASLDPQKNKGILGERSGEEFAADIGGALNRSIREEIAHRANEPGHKYVVVPKGAVREFVHQMEPPKGMDKLFGKANRFLSRIILGYSPAWAVAQLVAEGIPAATAIGANPLRWARVARYLAREDRQLTRKERAALDGTIGESSGAAPHPQTQLKPDTNLMGLRFFRLSSRNRLGRALMKGATGEALGVFDRYKGGKGRKAVAAAKADRELNSFVTSLSELMRGQRTIAQALKGKPLKEQMAYMATHPKAAAKMERYLDDVMGNWRALTRHEAKFAPLVVFYPFVRYSLRWTFWSFPKRHPVKAQILYFLSQQNAEEIEKLTGGSPPSPLDYTFPVYTSATDESAVLPGGSRIAPGMNALTTAIGKGEVESLATALNPALGIGVSAITGVDPLSGEKKAHSPLEHGLLALNQLLSMPSPSRLLDLNDIGQEQSDVSRAFEAMDPLRAARSAIFPFAPQSGERYEDTARLAKALDKSAFNPELGQDVVTKALEDVKRGDTRLAKRLVKARKGSDKASDEISALIQEYVPNAEGLPKLSDYQYEWLGKITGKRVFPYKPPKPQPFGIPSTDPEELREQFGLQSTSTTELRKQFGIK